jgi:uncharacterized protein with beta-barrel porin domain
MIGGSLAALTYAGDGDPGRCATDAVHDLCVAPTRDGAVVGFAANTAVADGASVYLRYEGNVSGPDSAHALTAGVRVSW